MKKSFILLFLVLAMFMVLAGTALATDCWAKLTQPTCETNTDCQWHVDPWGSWCEQKGCWNYYDQTSCGQSNNASSTLFINTSCSWTSSSNSWCSEVDCYMFNGDQNGCLVTANNTYGLRCGWDNAVDQWGSPCTGPGEKQCWTKSNQSSCQKTTG